jgi:triacylglycerol lipase
MKIFLPSRTALLIFALALSLRPVMASAASTYTQSRYPVVLVHGFLGFDTLLGVLDYFHGIEAELRAGGAQVYVVNLSAANSSELRGEQLLQELENLSALTGATKFNLIGHSQGGLSARYVAAVRPELVASVTTFGTPHQGSAVGDGLQKLAPAGSALRVLIQGFTNALATLISALGGHANPQDALAAFQSLSSAGANVFNQRFPQGAPTSTCGGGPSAVNGVSYFSFGGAAVLTNIFDISDAFLGAGALFFGGASNDGLVSECSSKWGRVIRSNLPWNHLDEVNQIVGIRAIFSPEPSSVYRSHVNRLKNLGL